MAAAPSSGPEGEREREEGRGREETASRLVTIQITRTFYATAAVSSLSLSSAHLRRGCLMHGGGGGGGGVARRRRHLIPFPLHGVITLYLGSRTGKP